MPYSGKNDPNLPSNVKKMSEADREKWVKVFNSVYSSCIKNDGTPSKCEGAAMKQANGVIKNQEKEEELSLIQKLYNFLEKHLGNKELAISMPSVYNQIQTQLYQQSEQAWLVDVFMDVGETYGVIAENGKLYRASIAINPQQNSAIITDRSLWVEVMQDYVPVQQSFQIRAQEDGTYRWFLIAGTSILNRNGEIDSADLFDAMISRCERTNEYPYLTFFHLGKDFQMGSCDYLARDGVVLIASGTFDPNNKIARAMLRAYEKEPDYWGSSIGFVPLDYVMQEIARDITLPVYKDGILKEISILPEEVACAVMTALRAAKEKNVMNERIRKALTKLAGDDESLVSEFESMVDDVNRTVETENLVHREVEEEPAQEEPVQEEPVQEEQPVTQTLELDDEMLRTIAEQAASSEKIVEPLKAMQSQLDAAVERMNAMQKEITDMHASLIKTERSFAEKLEVLQRTDDEKRREWEQDLSEKTINKIRVTYRPTQKEDSEEANPNLADIAQSTLANLK